MTDSPLRMQFLSPQTAQPRRLISLDLARLIAALGVVWIHSASSLSPLGGSIRPNDLGRYATPFFTFIAAYYASRSAQRSGSKTSGSPTFFSYAWSRVYRLYVPFLCWSAIYIAFKWLRFKTHLASDFEPVGWIDLLQGGSLHLWFLPFAVFVTIGAWLVARVTWRAAQSGRPFVLDATAVAMALCGIIWALTPMPQWIDDTLALRFMYGNVPAAFWGLAISIAGGVKTRREGTVLPGDAEWLEIGIAVLLFSMAGIFLGGTVCLLSNLAGFGLALAGLSSFAGAERLGRGADRMPRSWAAALPQIAFGIYLIHTMATGILRGIGTRGGWEGQLWYALVMWTIAAGTAAIVAAMMLRSPATAWLLCEPARKSADKAPIRIRDIKRAAPNTATQPSRGVAA